MIMEDLVKRGTAWLLGLPQLELHGAGARLGGALLALLPDAPQAAPLPASPAPADAQAAQAPAPADGDAAGGLAPAAAAGGAAVPPQPDPAASAASPAPAIVGSDFVPARLLARLFPDPGARPRLWAALDGELSDWEALGRVLDYWSPGLRLEKRDSPARLSLRAGGMPPAQDAPGDVPPSAGTGPVDPAVLGGRDWRQWLSLDAGVDLVRLHDRSGERLLLRELRRTNPDIEKSIFHSIHSVCLDTMVGYKSGGVEHTFADCYRERGEMAEMEKEDAE